MTSEFLCGPRLTCGHAARCCRRPAHAVYYAIYEEAKQAFGANEDERHHPAATAAAGALATAAGDAVNLPLDVVKQRLQVLTALDSDFG